MLARAVTGALGGQVGVAPRIYLKKLVADVLDRVDKFTDWRSAPALPAHAANRRTDRRRARNCWRFLKAVMPTSSPPRRSSSGRSGQRRCRCEGGVRGGCRPRSERVRRWFGSASRSRSRRPAQRPRRHRPLRGVGSHASAQSAVRSANAFISGRNGCLWSALVEYPAGRDRSCLTERSSTA
ncbi:hypothetical protein [Micromonospora sp. NPDC023814]|uniref:hypothetical protein n=1 Tax=Micromonospora sp. NPDC023814 TaxID=3154596 RepID=UPI0033D10B49